jgi:hypothetical protein
MAHRVAALLSGKGQGSSPEPAPPPDPRRPARLAGFRVTRAPTPPPWTPRDESSAIPRKSRATEPRRRYNPPHA